MKAEKRFATDWKMIWFTVLAASLVFVALAIRLRSSNALEPGPLEPGPLSPSALATVDLTQAQIVGPWPQWRGPLGDNHAGDDARAVLKWDLDSNENIAWKTAIPGRGHSTPIVTPAGIFMTTSDASQGTQSVLQLDTVTGKLLNEWVLHRGTLPSRIHPNNSHASPSMAFDGERLFASFYTDDSIVLTALSVDGQKQWQTRVSEFKPSIFQFGYGASPIIDDDLVIVAAEYDGRESGLYGINRVTGKQVWKTSRPSNLNFASPIIASIAGRRQLLLAGADMFCSYDPRNGKQLWSVPTTTEAICGTAVWDDRRVLVSGGNPQSGTWCVRADGQERTVWQNRVQCYEQSLLAIDQHVVGVADNGVAYCWRTRDGKEMWKKRLFGGGISASPMLVDGHVVVATERGTVFIFRDSPDRFQPIAEIRTGDSIFATPVSIGNRMYIRTGVGSGARRQEFLVAIGS